MKFLLIPLLAIAIDGAQQSQIDAEMLEDARLQYIENCDTGAYECTKEEMQEYENRGYDSFECHADKHGEEKGFKECWEKK